MSNLGTLDGYPASAAALQGTPVSTAAPTDGQALIFDGASGAWKPEDGVPGDITGVTAGTGLTGGGTSGTVTLAVDQTAALTWTGLESFNAASTGITSGTAAVAISSTPSVTGDGAAGGNTAIPKMIAIAPTINLTSTGGANTSGYTALDVDVTETNTGSGAKSLVQLRVGGTSKFRVSNAGSVTMPTGAVLSVGGHVLVTSDLLSAVNMTGAVPAANGGTALDTSASTGVPQVVSGTWTIPSAVAATKGGTGKTSYAVGDLLYPDGTTNLTTLAIGTAGKVLVSTGSAPSWGTVGQSSGGTNIDTSASTGVPVISSGTWSVQTALSPTKGGTGQTTIASKRVHADTAAGVATAEYIFDMIPVGATVTGVTFNPIAAVTASDTNYATVTIAKRASGAGATTLCTFTTKVTGGINGGASLSAFTTYAAASLASTAIVAADQLTIAIAKQASGASMSGIFVVTYTVP